MQGTWESLAGQNRNTPWATQELMYSVQDPPGHLALLLALPHAWQGGDLAVWCGCWSWWL